MELTKEYFDKQLDKRLKNLATKDDLRDFAKKSDLERFATKEDLRDFATKDDLKNFATKDDLKKELAAQSKELKQYAEEQTEFLARIVAKTVANPLDKLIQETKDQKLNARVTSLESDMKRIKKALLVD